MSTTKPYISIEGIRLEAELELAEFLRETNVITESEFKSHYMGRDCVNLMENASRGRSGAYFYRNTHYVDFKNVWNKVSDYPTIYDVYRALHPDSNASRDSSTPSTTVSRMLNKFLGKSGDDPGVPEARTELIAKSAQERNELEKKMRAREAEGYEGDPNDWPVGQSIDGGYRRKSSRTANIEKASELYPGELYNDHTRIPKRRWGVWWKRFFQKQTSVQNSTSGLLAISRWTKHFIMGYQATDKIFFEIWYNTYDSTFSVHDRYGNPARQGEDIPLIRDALNVLFHNISQYSPDDKRIIASSGPDLRRVNQDIARFVQGEVVNTMTTAERMKERKKAIADAKQKAAERDEREKQDRKNAGYTVSGNAERAAEDETDAKNSAAHDQMKKNSTEFREKMGRLGDRVRDLLSRLRKFMEDDEEISSAQAEMSDEPEEIKEIKKQLKARQQQMKEIEGGLLELKSSPNSAEDAEESLNSLDDLETDTFARMEREIYDARDIDPNDVIPELRALRSQKAKEGNTAKSFDQGLKDEYNKLKRQAEKNKKKGAKETDVGVDSNTSSSLEKEHPEMDGDAEKDADKAIKKTGHKKASKKRKKVNESTASGSTTTSSVARTSDPDLRKIIDYDDEEEEDDEKSSDVKENRIPGDDEDYKIDLQDYEENPLYHVAANTRVEQIRKQAENSPYTRQMLNNEFLEGFVKPYNKTRMKDTRSLLRRVIERISVFRGRPDRIVVPKRIVGIISRAKGFFAGAQARSDFVIGYTLNDVANFEIWYIQEISSDAKRQVASFYIYDATAMRIVESNLPHYRNAIQLLMLKIGSDAGGE